MVRETWSPSRGLSLVGGRDHLPSSELDSFFEETFCDNPSQVYPLVLKVVLWYKKGHGPPRSIIFLVYVLV